MDKKEISFSKVESEESQKIYSGGYANYNILGIPNSASGMNRRDQLAWTKRGVALAYMMIPTLKSAIDAIAENLASVPMGLKDKNGNFVARTDNSGSANNDFLKALEKSYSYYGIPLMQLWVISHLLYGETYVEKVKTFKGHYDGLKWLNPLATSVYTRATTNSPMFLGQDVYDRDEKFFTYTGTYKSVEYTEDELLYARGFNPVDDVKGYSSALSALSKANITIEFDNFTLAFYANNGHPAVIISPKDKLVGEKQVAEWQRSWQEKYQGSKNQFKTHISGFPFDVSTFDLLDVSKPMEVSKEAEKSILKAFRMSPEMIGDTTENSYQFSKESKNAFMQTVVKPLALNISNCINHSGIVDAFVGEGQGYKFGFDFSEFENVAKSDLDKQQVLEQQLKSGGISLGEYQRKLGNNVVEGADDTFLFLKVLLLLKRTL